MSGKLVVYNRNFMCVCVCEVAGHSEIDWLQGATPYTKRQAAPNRLHLF